MIIKGYLNTNNDVRNKAPFSIFYMASDEGINILINGFRVLVVLKKEDWLEPLREVLGDSELLEKDTPHLVVPLLTKNSQLRYIANWLYAGGSANYPMYPKGTGIIVDGVYHSTPCEICPNQVAHMCGECTFGTKDCIQYLKIG